VVVVVVVVEEEVTTEEDDEVDGAFITKDVEAVVVVVDTVGASNSSRAPEKR
jgi:hypothetical protein